MELNNNTLDQKKILSPRDAFKQALSKNNPLSNHITQGQSSDSKHGHLNTAKSGDDIGSSVIHFVNNILENAAVLKVSDIHIEPYKESSRIRLRRDGSLKEIVEYSEFLHNNFSAISTRVKIMASLDISEKRLPQDGAISFPYNNDTVDLRVSILPTGNGERIVMRLMDRTSLQMPLDQLGFVPEVMPKLIKAIKSPQGMILVTGPTGSGKSTTLYAILNALNEEDVNILTAEDPVEFEVDGIGQVHVKESIGLSFAAALRSFLRQDPEIIMVGEIRDKETGDIAVKASLTGHLVLSTLHTNNAVSTITRLLNMGIPSYLLTASLNLIIAQRLARVTCQKCKIEDPNPNLFVLKSLGFSEEQLSQIKLYRGQGCDHCFNTGYKGRRAIHEVLVVSKNIKEGMALNATERQLTEIAIKKDGFLTMQLRGKQLLLQGILSLDEYQRVLVIDD